MDPITIKNDTEPEIEVTDEDRRIFDAGLSAVEITDGESLIITRPGGRKAKDELIRKVKKGAK